MADMPESWVVEGASADSTKELDVDPADTATPAAKPNTSADKISC